MRPCLAVITILLAVASQRAEAAGPIVAIDFTEIGTQQVPDVYQQDWLRLNASDNSGNVETFNFTEDPIPGNAKGLGIVGGLSDFYVDTDERVVINFEDGILAESIIYHVGDATNGDGDGLLGEAVVRAWGPCDNLYPPVNVSGEGLINVSALFGNVPLNRVTIAPRDNDAFFIDDITVVPAGVETIIDFETMGTYQTTQIVQDGFEVTCFDDTGQPGTLAVTQNAGLGVVGGASAFNVDQTETIRVAFGGEVPTRCFYQVLTTCDNDGDGRRGEHRLIGRGPNGNLLGDVNTWGETVFDVNAIASGLPVLFYTITVRDNDCLRVRRMSYLCPLCTAPAPSACPGDLNGDNKTDVFDFATLAEDFGCDESGGP